MAKSPGLHRPQEIAFAVLALEQGRSLSWVAAELHRDRVGLMRALRSLGFPTTPTQHAPAPPGEEINRRTESLGSLPPGEAHARILPFRRLPR